MENAENSPPIPLRNSAVFLRPMNILIQLVWVSKNIYHVVEFRTDTRGLKSVNFLWSAITSENLNILLTSGPFQEAVTLWIWHSNSVYMRNDRV